MVELTSSQKSAVEKFISQKNRYGALFMEPGTGKTRTIIEIINRIPTDSVLWISRKSLKENTEDEFQKWNFKKDVFFAGVDQIRNGDNKFNEMIDFLEKHKSPTIIFDESTLIKNNRTNSFARCKYLRDKYAKFAFILNGTPITQSERDLWAQMTFLSEKILKMSYEEFLDLIEVRITYKKKGEEEKSFVSEITNMNYVEKLVKPYVFSAELTLNTRYRVLSVNYATDVDIPNYNVAKSLMKKTNFDALSAMQKWQHELSVEKERIESIEKIVDEKTLIFCKYRDTQELLEKRYPQALVMTYGKGAVGLNLQKYKRTIFYDLTFDFWNRKQAMYRTYRTGQSEDVEFIDVVSDSWLDKVLQDNQRRKGTLQDFLTKIVRGENNDKYK